MMTILTLKMMMIDDMPLMMIMIDDMPLMMMVIDDDDDHDDSL